jgi:hypothetical protein
MEYEPKVGDVYKHIWHENVTIFKIVSINENYYVSIVLSSNTRLFDEDTTQTMTSLNSKYNIPCCYYNTPLFNLLESI